MKQFLLILMVLFCLPSLASAQVVKIVRQVCGPFRCHFETGSGVVIGRTPAANGGNTYRILTVYHVCGNRWDMKVKEHVRRGHDYKMQAVTPAGRFPAQIAAWNGDAMLMLLTIDVPAGAPEIGTWEIADTLPSAGDAVTIHGYSYKRNCQYGWRSLTLRLYGSKEFETTSQFEEGESGGPIVKDGKIVGLCEGYDAKTKCGLGPSVVAIRWFLDLPAIGASRESEQSGLPVRGSESGTGLLTPSGLSVPRPGSVVPVPEPVPAAPVSKPGTEGAGIVAPAESGSGRAPTPAPIPDSEGSKPDSGGDAPVFTPPVDITEKRPTAEPDPLSSPAPIPRTLRPSPAAIAADVGRVVGKGLDLWSALAGAGIVAGTGGIGGLALLAWRGLKAGKAVAGAIHNQRIPGPIVNPSPQLQAGGATVASVIPPMVPLAPQNVNFVEIPTDFRRASVDYALAETGKRYPGTIGTLEVVKSLINQHLQANGHGQESLHA